MDLLIKLRGNLDYQYALSYTLGRMGDDVISVAGKKFFRKAQRQNKYIPQVNAPENILNQTHWQQASGDKE